MNRQQKIALKHPCRLAVETVHPRFAQKAASYSLIVTVNSGHE